MIYTCIPRIRLALDVHKEVKEAIQDASPVCIHDIHMHPSHTTCSRRARRGKGNNSRRIPCMYICIYTYIPRIWLALDVHTDATKDAADKVTFGIQQLCKRRWVWDWNAQVDIPIQNIFSLISYDCEYKRLERRAWVCCSVLRECVAVRCSALQCVAVCCSVHMWIQETR